VTRSTRWRIEAALAALFALVMTLVGAGTFWYFSVRSVHGDPGDIPSSVSVANTERYGGAIEEGRRLARALLVEDNLPALSVAVAADGEIVWAEALGWANTEQRLPATPRMRFHLGSVSKTMTAAAVLRLHERGEITLDAPVQAYVPDYPHKEWPITARQLMGDIAGVHRIRGDDNDQLPRRCQSLAGAVASFAAEPLLFQPGTRYRFSNNGWILLSAVVEGAAGEAFDKEMFREVFEPLGLTSTVINDADGVPEVIDSVAIDLGTKLGLDPEVRQPPDSSCLYGAGAFFSTPSDLVRFGSAMVKPGLLTADSIGLLQTPLTLASGASTDFSLGWRVETVPLAGVPTRLVLHRATPGGTTIALMTVPERTLVVAAAANTSNADGVDPFGRRVAEVFAELNPPLH
jgi:CubicO group peptidase (beta-lactamase class C family)